MSLSIVDSCVSCHACSAVCPNDAIYLSERHNHFVIDPKKCTECEGDYADPQCSSICPIEETILDSAGAAINPLGSLTGIPPEKMEEALREIQAR